MNIVVTGGAGFIGSHTAAALIRLGHSVAVVDELNDFYPPELKRRNLELVSAAGPVQFYQDDICDSSRMREIFQQHRPRIVIHLAARAGVRPSLEQPLLYERVNVHGTMVLLEASREAGVERFVLASSSSVYGIANQVPFREDDHALRPISPYAATKIACEKICYTYSHLYGLKTACLRFFTVYGPRQRPDLAIRKFVECIERGEVIPVFGDGSTGRDYTYIDDIVQGIQGAMELDSTFEVLNLGNSSPVTLSSLITTIERCVGKPAHIRRLPLQPGDVPITFADINKARRLIGYAPKTPLAEGIARFIAWRREAEAAAG